MTYKQILFLSLFLAPYTIIAKNTVKAQAQIDQQIQELEEKVYQIELEILKLGKMIEEKSEYLLDLSSKIQDIFQLVLKDKIKTFEKQNNDQPSSKEDQDKIRIELKNQIFQFLDQFYDTVKDNKKIKGMLIKNLFEIHETSDYKSFTPHSLDLLKFITMNSYFYEQNIQSLIKKYDYFVAEYSDLMNQLIYLQQQKEL